MVALVIPFDPNSPDLIGNRSVALSLALRGIHVFPCTWELKPNSQTPSKKPLVPWRAQSTIDLRLIKDWWTKWPQAIVGIDCGKSGLFVIDCDRHPGEPDGVAAFKKLLIENNDAEILNATPVTKTQSGGYHVIFSMPPGEQLGNSTGNLPPGIDVRGNGGFIVAPGSTLPDERSWQPLEKARSLNSIDSVSELFAPPQWLIEKIKGSAAVVKKTTTTGSNQKITDDEEQERDYISRAIEAIPSDNRDEWLSVGMALHDKGSPWARALWDAWSAKSKKFDPKDQENTWRGFDKSTSSNKKTTASLVYLAKQYGFDGVKATDLDNLPKIDAAWSEAIIKNLTAQQLRGANTNQNRLAPEQRKVLATVNAATLAGKPVPQRVWFVDEMIPAQNVTLIYGDGSTGKSLLALQLAAVTASPVTKALTKPLWIGKQPIYGKAVYVSAEDELDEVHRRLSAITPDLSTLTNLEIVPLAGEDAVLAAPDGREGLLKETPIFRALQDVLARNKPVLLILDTLADLFGGDEIKKIHARQFISMLRGLAFDYNCTVVLLAHPSQSGMSSGEGTSGNVAWNNSVRSRLYFERVLTHVDGRLIEEDKDLRLLSVKKSNRGPRPASILVKWKDGQFILEDRPEPNSDEAMEEVDRLFLALLRQFEKEGRTVSPNKSNSYAPTVFGSHQKSGKVTKRQLTGAMNRLLETGQIRIEERGPKSKTSKFLVEVKPLEDMTTDGLEMSSVEDLDTATGFSDEGQTAVSVSK